MRVHVVEQAMLSLLEYLEEARTENDKCATIKEFGIAAYIIAMSCEELEGSISDLSFGSPAETRKPLRLWPEAHRYFDRKADRDLINEIFFTTVADKMPTTEPQGEQ
jgi:hypothetical protein